MLKDLPPLEERGHQSLRAKGEEYFNALYKKQAKLNGVLVDAE